MALIDTRRPDALGALVYLQSEHEGEVPAVALSLDPIDEAPASDVELDVSLFSIADGARRPFARFRTLSREQGAPPSRVLALASCPGVDGWAASFRRAAGSAHARYTVAFAASPCCPSLGLHLLWARRLERSGGEGVYAHGVLTANGAIAVPAGAVVRHASAAADATDVTLTWTGLAAITVPAGRNFGYSPRGLIGPTTLTAAGDPLSVVVAWES